jgi:hypothetical protein
LPFNFPILGLNQALCESADLSILHWFYCSTISVTQALRSLTHSLSSQSTSSTSNIVAWFSWTPLTLQGSIKYPKAILVIIHLMDFLISWW